MSRQACPVYVPLITIAILAPSGVPSRGLQTNTRNSNLAGRPPRTYASSALVNRPDAAMGLGGDSPVESRV